MFVRAVPQASLKATELKRGILFTDSGRASPTSPGCVEALRADLERLADGAKRITPDQQHLYAAVSYDRTTWERVQHGLDRWGRR